MPLDDLFFFAESPNLPFFIKRSKFNNLPVYSDYKRGGNYKLTVIRKIKGDLQVKIKKKRRAGLCCCQGLMATDGFRSKILGFSQNLDEVFLLGMVLHVIISRSKVHVLSYIKEC